MQLGNADPLARPSESEWEELRNRLRHSSYSFTSLFQYICPGLILAAPWIFSSINPLVYRIISFLELVAVSVFLYSWACSSRSLSILRGLFEENGGVFTVKLWVARSWHFLCFSDSRGPYKYPSRTTVARDTAGTENYRTWRGALAPQEGPNFWILFLSTNRYFFLW